MTEMREGECSGCGAKMVRHYTQTSAACPHECAYTATFKRSESEQ